jgi:cytoskeletal protein CcmA (bactofilin family)
MICASVASHKFVEKIFEVPPPLAPPTEGGEVRGNIIGKNVVELTQRGRIIGNIATANLVMEPGAFFKGKCNMDHQSDDQELLNHSPVTQPCTLADAQPTA